MTNPVNPFSSQRALFDSDSDGETVVRRPEQQQVQDISRNIFSAAGVPARMDADDAPQQQQVRCASRDIFSAAGVPDRLLMDSGSDMPPLKRSRSVGKQKSPYLALGNFTLNGKQYPVQVLGQGNFHKVFTFTSNAEVVLNGESFHTSGVVLKILGENVGPNKVNEVIQDEEQGYMYLLRAGFPVPKRFADPLTFEDTKIPSNGNFWIVEKMAQAITGGGWKNGESFDELSSQDKQILTWTKSILTRMAREKSDLVNDFRKQNVMLNDAGEPVIIDFSMPDNDDFQMNLRSYVNDWANGNARIKEYLTSEFPEELQS